MNFHTWLRCDIPGFQYINKFVIGEIKLQWGDRDIIFFCGIVVVVNTFFNLNFLTSQPVINPVGRINPLIVSFQVF